MLAARPSVEGDLLIVPQACLKSGNVFIDDLTLPILNVSFTFR